MRKISVFILSIICFAFLVPQSWAGLSISNKQWVSLGNKHMLIGDLAFDSSYANGGEVFDYTKYGFTHVDQVWVQPAEGYTFLYGLSGESKLKVYTPAPPIVFEESVTLADVGGVSVGTLRYPAAFIMYVASGLTVYHVITETEIAGVTVPGRHQVKPSIADGVRTTLNFGYAQTEASGVSVTYVTQAWKEVYENRHTVTVFAGVTSTSTSSSAVYAGESGVMLPEAVAIESIYWYDHSAATGYVMHPTVKGQVATVTYEAPIDFTISAFSASGTGTSIGFLHLATSGDTVYVTYIAKPTSGFLRERFIEEDTISPTFDAMGLSSGAFGSLTLLYGTCGALPGDTTEWASLARSGTTDIGFGSVTAVGWAAPLNYEDVYGGGAFDASGLSSFTFRSLFRTAYGHTDSDDFGISYIWGQPHEIPGLVPLEALDGVNLSGLTGVQFMVIGR